MRQMKLTNIQKRNLYLFFFYLLSWTWGIIPSFFGGLVMLVLAPFGKVKFDRGRFYAVVGKNWGGLELGCFYVICKDCELDRRMIAHEGFGHSIQNCILGPLFPFVVAAPSAARYWVIYHSKYENKKKFVVALYALLITYSIIIVALFSSLWWLALGLFVYATILFIWLWFVEVPQYKEKPYPKYDDIWFEGTATGWGLQILNWYDKMSEGEDD